LIKKANPYIEKYSQKYLYKFLNKIESYIHLKNINYGYAALNQDGMVILDLDKQSSEDRYALQMYHILGTGIHQW